MFDSDSFKQKLKETIEIAKNRASAKGQIAVFCWVCNDMTRIEEVTALDVSDVDYELAVTQARELYAEADGNLSLTVRVDGLSYDRECDCFIDDGDRVPNVDQYSFTLVEV